MKLLDFDGLAEKGIKFSDTHIGRLIERAHFLSPSRLAIAIIGLRPRSTNTLPTSLSSAITFRRLNSKL